MARSLSSGRGSPTAFAVTPLRNTLWLAVVALFLLLGVTRASAQEQPRGVWLTGCSDLDQDEVRRIALIELGAEGPARVDIECKSDRLELSASYRDRTARKTVSLSAVEASSRPRLVALSAAELVHELERLAGLPPKPPVAQPLPAPSHRPPRFALTLGPTFSAPTRGKLFAPGGQLLVQAVLIPRLLRIGVGAEASQASRTISGGDLRLRSASALVNLRALAPVGPVSLFAELALLGNYDDLRGTPSSGRRAGSSFHAASFSGRLGAGLELPFMNHGLSSLALGIARKSRTLYANNEGQKTTQVGPWFVSAALSVGAQW